MLDNQRKSQLQRILNDDASTPEERLEAKRQLEDTPSTEDKIIERYLDSKISTDELEIVDPETRSFCLCLPRPSLLGDLVDTREEALARLIELYRRTGSARVRVAVVDAVRAILRRVCHQLTPENRAKHDAYISGDGSDQLLVRQYFMQAGGWPGVERIKQKAVAFLESH
jgi:hypothetical protein